MKGRSLQIRAAWMLYVVLVLSACSSTRAVTSGGTSTGEPTVGSAQAGDSVPGREVTKEVPHATESVPDIKDREAKDPLPPRGDVAIPSHRIRPGDNTVAPEPPAGAPAGNDKPGAPYPGSTGGY